MSIEAAAAHGRRRARPTRGARQWAGEGEQSRARPGDGSPMRNPRWRGDVTGSEIATAAASRTWRCKRLGGEESKEESVGNDGERRGPFIVAGEGHTGARKGEMASSNGLYAIGGGAA
jgi:hypothetical protein